MKKQPIIERRNSTTRRIEYMVVECRQIQAKESKLGNLNHLNFIIDNTLSVNGLSINRNSNKDFVTVGFDGLINFYDSNSFKKTNTLTGHSKGIWCCIYSPSDKILATGSSDNNVMIWDTNSYKSTNTLKGHSDAVLKFLLIFH